MRAALAAALLFVLVAPAAAQNRSHRHQFGIATTAGSGYRVLFKYSDAGTCGFPGKNVCDGRLPVWFDVKLFYGFTDNFEVVVEHRFGLEKDFTASNQFMLMPGIRVYPSGRDPFKFFIQLQFVFDYTDPGNTNPNRYDFGFHEANGFQWDFVKWAGAYIQISETFTFLRSFSFQIEAGAGFEGRFP